MAANPHLDPRDQSRPAVAEAPWRGARSPGAMRRCGRWAVRAVRGENRSRSDRSSPHARLDAAPPRFASFLAEPSQA